ncbi:MAG: zinc ribbon domain-containing protein [Thermodesulfobacteriota bacterium]
MPIYEYRCSDCSRLFEKIIWNSQNVKVRCPYCQGDKVLRVLSAFSKSGGKNTGISMSSSCGPSSSGFS